ncbi:MAG: fumarylacetoacetate hydrolase family protein [Lachnospiraceae bacterium]|nr:fumarylacetoacetate hydrolase family protein [Lachnospiraceae bacterium]
MKLLTYQKDGNQILGKLTEDGRVCSLDDLGIHFSSMNDLIAHSTPEQLKRIEAGNAPSLPYDAIVKCSPIPVPAQDIICLGINYMAHAEESARYKKEAFGGERPYAVYFSKRVDCAVPDGGYIQAHTDMVERLDYEAELALIIGKEAKNVPKEDAYDYIFGYTIINDVSAREVQTNHKQWYFGKSLDGFTPMGPWIVTADEIPGRPMLPIRSYVNGELRQNSTTDLFIFDIPHVISELSHGMTLRPGTIISMGTPAGVGMGFNPPKFLKPGDVVTCEIEGIGTLCNTIHG